MRLFFIILSICYISVIFLYADSSVVSDLSPFNPYSILHVPLYGILTVLLFFSVDPSKSIQIRHRIKGFGSCDNGGNLVSAGKRYYLIAGTIALCLAIADEYYQSFIPSRSSSLGDLILDSLGIGLFLLLIPGIKRALSCSKAGS